MSRLAVFVLGPDRPGIIAAVTQVLFEHGCNLEDVSQTSLRGLFVGIFIASRGERTTPAALEGALHGRLEALGLSVRLQELGAPGADPEPRAESYVITTVGPDRPGLVAGVTALLAGYQANITNLKAITRGLPESQEYVTFYEIDLPVATDRQAFRAALRERGRELGLDVNLQHREIFEQIHRI